MAGGRDHTIRVPAGVKVLDAAGQELPEGLKAKDLHEGAGVILTVERQGDKLVLQAIRLTGKPELPAGRRTVAKQTTDPVTRAPQTRPSEASSSAAELGGEWEPGPREVRLATSPRNYIAAGSSRCRRITDFQKPTAKPSVERNSARPRADHTAQRKAQPSRAQKAP